MTARRGRKRSALELRTLEDLRVLKEAKARSLIAAVKPALDGLVSSGTYIGAELYREFLKQVGEPDN